MGPEGQTTPVPWQRAWCLFGASLKQGVIELPPLRAVLWEKALSSIAQEKDPSKMLSSDASREIWLSLVSVALRQFWPPLACKEHKESYRLCSCVTTEKPSKSKLSTPHAQDPALTRPKSPLKLWTLSHLDYWWYSSLPITEGEVQDLGTPVSCYPSLQPTTQIFHSSWIWQIYIWVGLSISSSPWHHSLKAVCFSNVKSKSSEKPIDFILRKIKCDQFLKKETN